MRGSKRQRKPGVWELRAYIGRVDGIDRDRARRAQALDRRAGDRLPVPEGHDHGVRPAFLLDDHLTVADFAVSVTLPHAETIKLPFDHFTNIARWKSQLEELPSWRDPFPKAQAQAA